MAGNPIMVRNGYGPAVEVARALSLALSTIHRMVDDGRVEGTRMGRALYVKLSSLEAFYDAEGNEPFRLAVAALRASLVKELDGDAIPPRSASKRGAR